MTQNPVLTEASFADAIAILASSAELPDQIRKHWATSLRQIAKALDKPIEVIPARYSAICKEIAHLHEVPVGLTAKTMRNHKSNAKSALLWLAREKDVPRHGTPLTVPWERLWVATRKTRTRYRLSSLMRYCSAKRISPDEVDEAILDRFMDYRRERGIKADEAFRRFMARAWNSHVGRVRGWSARRLIEPPVKTRVKIPWSRFPGGLRREIDRYLETLTRMRRTQTGRRVRPLSQATIHLRRAQLAAAARMAVASGVPIETLNSLGRLLAPDVVEKILDAYWRRNGEEPKSYTIDLAKRLLMIARETKCIDDSGYERLDEMRAALEIHRRDGLTDKNIALVRKILTPGVWGRVVKVPFSLMASARARRTHSPVLAAVTAQVAVAIAILTAAPVRIANLTTIRLGLNLIKPGGPDSNYWLVFPEYDVKNRVKLEFPLEPYLSRIIDEYVFDHRPTLMKAANEDWLFPGPQGGTKGKSLLSGQVTNRIIKETGLRITAHQFRHAAGAIILMRRPGEYELVRRILGHRTVRTTISAYGGLETIQASEIFGKIVMEHLDGASEAAE
jgi:hypothetical protein